MAMEKAAARFVACAMALVVVCSGLVVPARAHAEAPGLAAGDISTQAAKTAPKADMTLKTQAQSDMTVFGVDVSEHQGYSRSTSIDWGKLAKKAEFAIVRCGYGDNLRRQDDKDWIANARGCRKAGIPMGVYLYSYARNTTMAKSEANHVIRCLCEAGITPKTLQLPIYLDMEDASAGNLAPASYAKIFNAFKKKLAAAGYGNVGVYANASWWSWRLSTVKLDSELRWVAQWGTLYAGYPTLSEKGCGVWQYTDAAKASGIKGAVDGNYARYDWSFLGGSGPVDDTEADDDDATTPVYMLYRAKTSDYIYTTSVSERNNLKRNGWKYKGTLGAVPVKTSMPVFRFYDAAKKAHYYTTSKSKYNTLARKSRWAYEGVAFYSQLPKSGSKVNRFTKSGKYRYKTASDFAGWKANGVGWYSTS